MKPIAVVDIEGTLSDCSHRIHLLNNKDYHAWNVGLAIDPPRLGVIKQVGVLAQYMEIHLLTAKPAQYRSLTRAWLDRHITFRYQLHMRLAMEVDWKSVVVKEKMLQNLRSINKYPIIAIDDRQDIIDMYANCGIATQKV